MSVLVLENRAMTKDYLNTWLDRNRWFVAAGVGLGLLGFGVITPNIRLTNVEAQQALDHKQLEVTTAYMRVLATAQCLELSEASRKQNTLLDYMCERVLADHNNLRLP